MGGPRHHIKGNIKGNPHLCGGGGVVVVGFEGDLKRVELRGVQEVGRLQQRPAGDRLVAQPKRSVPGAQAGGMLSRSAVFRALRRAGCSA